jgi:small subunit ribosomal protein S14
MAKKSSIENNDKRKRMIESKRVAREALRIAIKNPATTFDDRMDAVHKLAEMPRNSSPVRYRNRCKLTGRSRGYYRKFAMSRIMLRDLASAGMLPGVIKASW